jgi:electron transfer flavoprotein alpha subunit
MRREFSPSSLYSAAEARDSIWVYLEHQGEILAPVSRELLAKGRQLAGEWGYPLVGLVMGWDVDQLAEAAFAYGADEVVLGQHSLLELFSVDAYSQVAFHALMEFRPSIFLLGATPNGRDLAGRLAVRLRTGLNADCTQLRVDPNRGVLICEVSGFGGGVLALIEMERHRPQMATVRPGVFVPEEPEIGRKGEIHNFTVNLSESEIRTRIVEQVIGEGVDLTQTPVLVVGGRGVDGEFDLLRELADLIGGEVGATRPPVDEGHIERERQIGQTGVVCRPETAIVCGVSGAFHFVVGIEEAGQVIAINTDPESAIFDYADYCLLADVHDVLPAVIDYLKEC